MAPTALAPRRYSIRRAVSIAFALASLLPLATLAYALYLTGGYARPQVQLLVVLAGVCVLIGAHLLRELTRAVAERLAAAAAAHVALERGDGEDERLDLVAAGPVEFHLPGFGTITPAEPEPVTHGSPLLPGAIEELSAMWRAEADPLVGQRVLVSVRNASEPVVGTLVQVTPDGLLLTDDQGQRVGVSYRRISALERAPR